MWKTWEEMENSITLEELRWIVRGKRDEQEREFKQAAALQGIDLGDNQQQADTSFDEVKRRVAAKMQNRSEEYLHFDELGIDVEKE